MTEMSSRIIVELMGDGKTHGTGTPGNRNQGGAAANIMNGNMRSSAWGSPRAEPGGAPLRLNLHF